MKIKVCGITRLEDALLAEQLGADYIGFIFEKTSKRFVSIEAAKRIAQRLTIASPVGVFVQESDDEIAKTIAAVGLKAVQIYRPVTKKIENATTIEAIRVKDSANFSAIGVSSADYYLLDAYHEAAYGGTGKRFDWTILPKKLDRVFLAGGITPENVREAVNLHPFAIDVCSGVESKAGIKDEEKLTHLFEEIAAC